MKTIITILFGIMGVLMGYSCIPATSATNDSSLLLSTFLGGSGKDIGYSVAVDPSGNIYVAGTTYTSGFPMVNPYQGTLRGTSDGFIAKFNPTGTDLLFSTFLGGSGDEDITSITVDAEGQVYLTGWTSSGNYPVTPDAFDGVGPSGMWDAFLSIVDTATSGSQALMYSTYLGGSNMDKGTHVDKVGNYVYVTGYTASPNFPLANAADDSLDGYQDAFAFVIQPGDTAPMYATYFGGSAYEASLGGDTTLDGSLYFTGWTSSSDFPTTTGSDFLGVYDLFVVKLTPSGDLDYSMIAGGSGRDIGWSVNADGLSAFVAGETRSTDFPITLDALDEVNQGGICGFGSESHPCQDAFFIRVAPQGGIEYSTYLGGSRDETAYAVQRWDAYTILAGSTNSSEFLTSGDVYDPTFNGDISLLCEDGLPCPDAFLTVLTDTGALHYSTFLGALRDDTARSVWLASLDKIHLAGFTDDSGFPTIGDAYDTSHNGNADAFVAALNAPGIQTRTVYLSIIIK